MPSVEWETLLFFAGLFVMIGALVKTGVIGQMAQAAARASGGDPPTATMLILGVSALLSGVVDNIPYCNRSERQRGHPWHRNAVGISHFVLGVHPEGCHRRPA
jgi:Citrate transporter